jgi:hypothetical protein
MEKSLGDRERNTERSGEQTEGGRGWGDTYRQEERRGGSEREGESVRARERERERERD